MCPLPDESPQGIFCAALVLLGIPGGACGPAQDTTRTTSTTSTSSSSTTTTTATTTNNNDNSNDNTNSDNNDMTYINDVNAGITITYMNYTSDDYLQDTSTLK